MAVKRYRYTTAAKEKAYYEKRNRQIELSKAARAAGAKYKETKDAYGNIRRTLVGGDKELTSRTQPKISRAIDTVTGKYVTPAEARFKLDHEAAIKNVGRAQKRLDDLVAKTNIRGPGSPVQRQVNALTRAEKEKATYDARVATGTTAIDIVTGKYVTPAEAKASAEAYSAGVHPSGYKPFSRDAEVPDSSQERARGSHLPDIEHLAKENAIPASAASLATYGSEEYNSPEAIVARARALPPEPRHEKSPAAAAERWKTKTVGEAVAEANAKGQAERDAKFHASRQSMSGGDFESKHPRKPSGSAAGGEFTNKK
jgi:hypothetical protein